MARFVTAEKIDEKNRNDMGSHIDVDRAATSCTAANTSNNGKNNANSWGTPMPFRLL